MHLKFRRRDDVKSSMALEEGEFNVPIDDCLSPAKYLVGLK